MTGTRTLKFLSAPFENWNPKGSFFVGTFEKFGRRHQILSASLKEKSEHPLFLHWHYFVVVVVAEGSLSNDDNDGSENVAKKIRTCVPFKFYRVYLDPLSCICQMEAIFSWRLILKDFIQVQKEKGEIVLVFSRPL